MLAKFDSKTKHQKRDQPICTYCKIHGHTVDMCYKLHGFPLGYKPKIKGQVNVVGINSIEAQNSGTSIGPQGSGKPREFSVSSLSVDQCDQLIGMLSTRLVASTSSIADVHSTSLTAGTYAVNNYGSFSSSNSIWIIDSGASRHICVDRSSFPTLKQLHNSTVTLPNHTTIPVHFHGNIKICETLTLRDVLYVPDFKFNLISVSVLTANSKLVLVFSNDGFAIHDMHTKRTIGKGRRWNDLYVFQAVVPQTSYVVNKVSVQVWHDRLDHPSFQKLQSLEHVLEFSECGAP